jgi:hypothetical protein
VTIIENETEIIIQNISDIQERVNDIDNKLDQMEKKNKNETIAIRKIITEMINERFNRFEMMLRENLME